MNGFTSTLCKRARPFLRRFSCESLNRKTPVTCFLCYSIYLLCCIIRGSVPPLTVGLLSDCEVSVPCLRVVLDHRRATHQVAGPIPQKGPFSKTVFPMPLTYFQDRIVPQPLLLFCLGRIIIYTPVFMAYVNCEGQIMVLFDHLLNTSLIANLFFIHVLPVHFKKSIVQLPRHELIVPWFLVFWCLSWSVIWTASRCELNTLLCNDVHVQSL